MMTLLLDGQPADPVMYAAVLVDCRGRTRKLIAMASRSGYFFLLDRATGESLPERSE